MPRRSRLARARAALLVLALLPASATRAGGQDAPRTPRTVWHETRRVPDDVAFALRAAGRLDGREAGTVAGVFALTALVSVVDDDIDAWIARDSSRVVLRLLGPVREGGRFAIGELPTGTRIPALSALLYVAGLAGKSPELREAGLGCLSAFGANALVRYSLYLTMRRTRPVVAEGDQYRFAVGGGDWNEQSFFGGHVANAAACTTFLSERFDLGAGEPALYLFSGAIGFARMADRRHWASDIVLGAAFGSAVGRAIAIRSQRRADRAAGRAVSDPIPLATVHLRF